MSSAFNEDSQNYLILDFGINPSSKTVLTTLNKHNNNQILELKPNQMKNADWDHVLDLIIKNNKCIAL